MDVITVLPLVATAPHRVQREYSLHLCLYEAARIALHCRAAPAHVNRNKSGFGRWSVCVHTIVLVSSFPSQKQALPAECQSGLVPSLPHSVDAFFIVDKVSQVESVSFTFLCGAVIHTVQCRTQPTTSGAQPVPPPHTHVLYCIETCTYVLMVVSLEEARSA